MPKYDFDVFGPDSSHYGPQGSQTVYNTGMLGGIVIIANLLFAATMIMAMQRYAFSPVAAILLGALYYATTTTLALLIISGALGQMYIAKQEQTTIRHRDTLHYSVMPRPALPSADTLQLPSGQPVEQLQGPLGGATFVPAEDMTTRRDAALWAVSLYGPDGQADPSKVSLKGGTEPPGRLKVAAPGSAAKEYLLAKRVLQKIDHGYRLNLGRYPDAQTLRDILND